MPIVLTNPQGQTKEFPNTLVFDDFLLQVVNTKPFREWSTKMHMPGTFQHGGKVLVNTLIVKTFLKEKGYKIEYNWPIKPGNNASKGWNFGK